MSLSAERGTPERWKQGLVEIGKLTANLDQVKLVDAERLLRNIAFAARDALAVPVEPQPVNRRECIHQVPFGHACTICKREQQKDLNNS